MAKGFASTTDMAEKKITFSEIGTDLYAFTAEGDPNSAIIVGDDGCLVFDAQSTPAMAHKVIDRVLTTSRIQLHQVRRVFPIIMRCACWAHPPTRHKASSPRRKPIVWSRSAASRTGI